VEPCLKKLSAVPKGFFRLERVYEKRKGTEDLTMKNQKDIEDQKKAIPAEKGREGEGVRL